MLRSLSKSFVLRGLLAIVVGIIALAWPGVTIGAVVVIFAIAVFFDAVGQGVRAFSSEKAGPVAGHLLLALLDIAAAVVAIAWPDVTALALTIWIGAWAVVIGIGELGMAFMAGETAGERALFGFGGLLSVALGIALFARPDVGALSLAQVFGLFSLAFGLWNLVLAGSTHATQSRIEGALGSGP